MKVYHETFAAALKLIKQEDCQVTSLPSYHVPNSREAQGLQNSGDTSSVPMWISVMALTYQNQTRTNKTLHFLRVTADWNRKLRNESNQHDWPPKAKRNVTTSPCVILLHPTPSIQGRPEETEEGSNDIVSLGPFTNTLPLSAAHFSGFLFSPQQNKNNPPAPPHSSD